MSDLRRRIGRLEAISGGPSGPAPTEAQWHEALAITGRYWWAWGTPKLLVESLGLGELPKLSAEDQAFVEECEAGSLAAAQGIDERYREAHGITVDREALKKRIAEMLAEPGSAA